MSLIVQLFFGRRRKISLDCEGKYSYFPFSPKSHVPMGVRRTLELVRKSVRYLELTPPVAIPANRKMRGRLKQRRCGPFCSLPAFHQRGLLKRHTFIAGSAAGIFPPIHGRQSRTYTAFAALVHYLRVERRQGSGVSTGWFLSDSRTPFVLRFMPELWNWKRESI